MTNATELTSASTSPVSTSCNPTSNGVLDAQVHLMEEIFQKPMHVDNEQVNELFTFTKQF